MNSSTASQSEQTSIVGMSSKLKVGIISLGCAKNLVDSEAMLGILTSEGFQLCSIVEDADVVIINTCGFIEASKQESIDTILQAGEFRTNGKCRALIVAGCLTQRYPQDLKKELPEVDAILGLNEVPRIGQIVRELLETKQGAEPKLYWKGPAQYIPDYATPRFRLTPNHFAYVKIAEGCNHPCTFCSIPRIRGRHRSRTKDDVLAEIRSLVCNGVKEINLISQDTTFYGLDLLENPSTLSDLLRGIQQIEGDFWTRVLYTHPAHWSDELIDTIAACDKVCRYIDMPLQHINDGVLSNMRRETSGQYIRKLIRKIRTGIPEIALRTTLIVGFPGETEEQFEELLQFVEAAQFERLGVFTYSQEDHTRAGTMQDQLPVRIKRQRHHRLMALQQKISKQVHRKYIGRKMRVLIDRMLNENKNLWLGRSHADAPEIDGSVRVSGPAVLGEFVVADIIDSSEYDLVGETCTGP